MKKPSILVFCTLLLASTPAFAGLWFWDKNGTTAGSGSATPTGTWGTDAYWNDDGGGVGGANANHAWNDGGAAVFAAGNDAVGAYTVNVTSNLWVADIHVDLGSVTFNGGPIKLNSWDNNNTNRLLSVGHKSATSVARYNTPLTYATNIIRYKRGTLILGATNTYTGSTTIEGGVLQLGVSYALPLNTTLVLANNDTLRTDFDPAWQFTPAVFATGGFSQKLGTLQLTGSDASVTRALDFGNGNSALAFANSSAEDWSSFTLTITNFTLGHDTLRFGLNSSGLTSGQLAQTIFADYANLPAQINSAGFVTPQLPVLLPAARTAPSTVTLTWTSVIGRVYRAQYKTNLNDPAWIDLVPDVFASDVTATTDDTSAVGASRFYRVTVLP